jgi:sigma-B regulation protein RsbU (phosphoserine phosphatase)
LLLGLLKSCNEFVSNKISVKAKKNITCDEIGGDYFDFLWDLECQNNHFAAVVGDVTSHGVDAALLMTTARAFLRMRASQCGGISRIVTEMNRHLTLFETVSDE